MRLLRKCRAWFLIYWAIATLVVAQVGWWGYVFLKEVSSLEALRVENLKFKSRHGDAALSEKVIANEAFHRRVMFLSESVFFLGVTCFGLLVLYRMLRSEERSREIEKNFIETLSHESKTPVTALKLRLEALNEKQKEDPTLVEEYKRCLAEVKRLSSIFEKAMALNRLERHAFSFERILLSPLVREAIHRMEPFFSSRDVHVDLTLDPSAEVLGDPSALESCLENVFENAILYNQRKGKRLQIGMQTEDRRVVIHIRDNGPGIPVAERTRLFERFFRGKNSTSIPGTGLGLHLTKLIVEAHRGSVQLIDAHRGGSGSHFRIELPACG